MLQCNRDLKCAVIAVIVTADLIIANISPLPDSSGLPLPPTSDSDADGMKWHRLATYKAH